MKSFQKLKIAFLFLFSLILFNSIEAQTVKKVNKTITGKITHEKIPLKNVTVTTKKSKIGTTTDAEGSYSLKVSDQDTLLFNHLGYSTITVSVKNRKIINIEMIPESFMLEEVLLKKAKSNIRVLEDFEKPFKTAFGVVNPRAIAHSYTYIKAKETAAFISITEGLQSRVASYRVRRNEFGEPLGFIRGLPVLWDVNGFVTNSEPPINLIDVKEIRVLGSPEASLRYGNRCGTSPCGGVIVVTLKEHYGKELTEQEKIEIREMLANIKGGENEDLKFGNSYSETLRNINNINESYNYCKKILNRKKNNHTSDLRLIYDYYDFYQNKKLLKSLGKDYINKYKEEEKALNLYAQELEVLQMKKEYLEVYKLVYDIDKNPKTIRNLVNAFIDNNQYQTAWKLYESYVRQNPEFSKHPIDDLIFNEMEWLHSTKNQFISSGVKFRPKNKTKENFKKDLRVVVEWDNSDVDFYLNFKSKSKEAITFKYEPKKEEEYSTLIQEFFFNQFNKNDWDIDLTYFRDKENQPTNLKLTYFFNWGAENEFKKTKTYKLNKTYSRIKLAKL